jgi:hypothetical protein
VVHVAGVLGNRVATLVRGRLAVPAQVDVDDAKALGGHGHVALEESGATSRRS